MGLFNRGKKEEKEAEEYSQNMALTEEGSQKASDQIDILRENYHMIKDDQVTILLWDDPKLRNLIPASSALNRLGNIDAKEVKIQRLKYKLLLLKKKALMTPKEYANGGSILHSSLDINFRNIPNDSFHGWKGRITTERTKTIRTVLEKKKKGRF